jgi:hypothetical protein
MSKEVKLQGATPPQLNKEQKADNNKKNKTA